MHEASHRGRVFLQQLLRFRPSSPIIETAVRGRDPREGQLRCMCQFIDTHSLPIILAYPISNCNHLCYFIRSHVRGRAENIVSASERHQDAES